jgi:hypothetical protein
MHQLNVVPLMCCLMHLQLFFKRSTLYIPFVLVGAYFANEVRSSKLQDRPAARSRPSLTQVQQQQQQQQQRFEGSACSSLATASAAMLTARGPAAAVFIAPPVTASFPASHWFGPCYPCTQ